MPGPPPDWFARLTLALDNENAATARAQAQALVRTQLRRSLELRGYTVVEAIDGRAALATIEEARPDVVVLDMTMPDIDGAEVLRRLRATGSRVPVIVSSGYLDVSVERRLSRGDFQAFLAKPYSASDLAAAMDRALAPAATAADLPGSSRS